MRNQHRIIALASLSALAVAFFLQGCGSGGSSSTATPTPPPNVAPNTPTGFGATTVGSNINLTWAASSNTTSYNVLFSTNPSGPFAIATTVPANVLATSVALPTGNYFFQLVAVNGSGSSGVATASANVVSGGGATQVALTHTGNNDITTVDGSTGYLQNEINDATFVEQSPEISPDGQKIVYISNEGGPNHIWVRRLTASGSTSRKQITIGAGFNDSEPSWSPDGHTIVFVTTRWGIAELCSIDTNQITTGSPTSIPAIPSPTDPERRLTNNSLPESRPRWQPISGSSRIAYVVNNEIHVLDASGDTTLLQVNTETYNDPQWSPDGSKIAYTTNHFGTPISKNIAFVTNITTTNPTQYQVTNTNNCFLPMWNPNGSSEIGYLTTAGSLFRTTAGTGGVQTQSGVYVPGITGSSLISYAYWGKK